MGKKRHRKVVGRVKYAAFNAVSPFELGDKIIGADGKEHTITDIVAMHSVKAMYVRFVYELDNSGELVRLTKEEIKRGV